MEKKLKELAEKEVRKYTDSCIVYTEAPFPKNHLYCVRGKYCDFAELTDTVSVYLKSFEPTDEQVEAYAAKHGLNIETRENWKEARLSLIAEKTGKKKESKSIWLLDIGQDTICALNMGFGIETLRPILQECFGSKDIRIYNLHQDYSNPVTISVTKDGKREKHELTLTEIKLHN